MMMRRCGGLIDLLNLVGYHATGSGNFREALDLLSSTVPDLLITDIRLEGYNGLQLVLSRPEGLPAIVMTGHDDPVLAADARRYGASYMLKPVNPEQFLMLVKSLLNPAGPD